MAGSAALSSAATLKAFCRFCGDIDLANVSAETIATYVSRPGIADSTKASVFSGLKCFVAYQQALRRMQAFSLRPPPKVRDRRLPRIYTPEQVRLLLEGTTACQSTSPDCDGETFRLALLLLYATGATVSEVLRLRRSDLRRRSRTIRLGNGDTERWLPVSRALMSRLGEAIRSRHTSEFIVRNRHGSPLSPGYMAFRFGLLTRQVGIGLDSSGHSPRLQDFRYTFAVHRIESWLKRKADLNVLLPALSTYMGYADLLKAEEFLSLTPESFRGDLEKLSPSRRKPEWKNDPDLLDYLVRL